MSFFIQAQQRLVTHRKTLRLARLLSLDRYAVVGRLVALWVWSLDHAPDGALGEDMDAEVLADVMGWDASTNGKPAELLEALLAAGFLELDSSGDTSDPSHPTLRIHDWQKWQCWQSWQDPKEAQDSMERLGQVGAAARDGAARDGAARDEEV